MSPFYKKYEDLVLKLSRNTIITPKSPNSYIIANTLTRSIIEVNRNSLDDIKKGNPDKLSELTLEQFNECIDMGFLVPDFLNEDEFLNHILLRERISPQNLISYVMYSSLCNFACKYCYEIGQIKDKTMEKGTIDDLMRWYKYRFENGDFKGCYIFLYGGEPLLFIDFFLRFLKKMHELTKHYGISLKTGLFTNGFLLSKEIVYKLLSFNLEEINVTIDGSPKTHNFHRPLKHGKNKETFDVILKNLIDISSLNLNTKINCRISFSKSNLSSIPQLLEIIRDRDNAGNIEPYFAHITQTSFQMEDVNSFCYQNVLTDDNEIADAYIFLYKKAKIMGFEIPDFITLGPCMVYAVDSGIISPDGQIYKCLDMVGFENLSVGKVSFPIYYKSNYYKMIKAEKLNYCLNTDCPFVPICGGGCVMEPLLKYGDYKKIICHRNMLEKIHKELFAEKFS
ncbi:MAG: radical SAM protein [Candidatus Hermodarchaeota archaeon]